MNRIELPYNCQHRSIIDDKDVPYHECPYQMEVHGNSDEAFCNCCNKCATDCENDAGEVMK